MRVALLDAFIYSPGANRKQPGPHSIFANATACRSGRFGLLHQNGSEYRPLIGTRPEGP